jgi:serine protease Do
MTKEILAELAKPEPEINLLRCALLLARHDNPEIDVASYVSAFKSMVADLKDDPEIKKGTIPAVKRLNRYFFEENGFHGSRHDYGSRSNSYINEVIDDREGLPITLERALCRTRLRARHPGRVWRAAARQVHGRLPRRARGRASAHRRL